MYQPRTYRRWVKDKDLVSFDVVVKETDLYIRAKHNLRQRALKAVLKYRTQLEKYIERHPAFLTALEPYPIEEDAPDIVKEMAEAGRKAGVGPMASVAGAIAECVGIELIAFSPEVIVENGGDIFLKSLRTRLVGVYAAIEDDAVDIKAIHDLGHLAYLSPACRRITDLHVAAVFAADEYDGAVGVSFTPNTEHRTPNAAATAARACR